MGDRDIIVNIPADDDASAVVALDAAIAAMDKLRAILARHAEALEERERAAGIEPTSDAYKASALPLS